MTTGDFPHFDQQTGQTFIFDPASQRWARSGDLGHPPSGVNAVVLLIGSQCADKCGKVLVAGFGGTSQLFTP